MKSTQHLFLLCCAFLMCSTANAQTGIQLTQYQNARQLFNPAYSASTKLVEGTAGFRSQWVGLTSNAITTQYLDFHMPLPQFASAVGITIVNDQIGLLRNTRLVLNYSFKLPINKFILTVGGGVGAIQASLNGDELRTPTGEYLAENRLHNDAILPQGRASGFAPVINLGTYFVYRDFFGGIGMYNYAPVNASLSPEASSGLRFEPVLNFTGGARFDVKRKIELRPSFLVKTNLKQYQVDQLTEIRFQKKYWTGIGFSGVSANTFKSVNLLLGIKVLKKIEINYTLDVASGQFGVTGPSHEITLRYVRPTFLKPKRGVIEYNPRYQ